MASTPETRCARAILHTGEIELMNSGNVLDGLCRDRLQRLLAGDREGAPFVLAGSP
jgi:hypothetical protein